MAQTFRLLEILADGRFHSGEVLGEKLGISRTAVWKALRSCAELGVELHAVPGRGYRLAAALELLHGDAVVESMGEASRKLLGRLEIHRDLDSTNRHLMRQAAGGAASGHVCLAERQTAGRGRRGRHWVSPFGANLYLSVLWRFEAGPACLGGLSLAVGVGMVRALQGVGIRRVGLKWPNDVVWEGRKLAGVLVEMSGESAGPCHVVVGVGLNVRMPKGPGEAIDQPWVDVGTVAEGKSASRSRLAGLVLDQVLQVLAGYQHTGLKPYLEDWSRLDVCAGRPVVLESQGRRLVGEARGVSPDGALILRSNGVERSYQSGEVSLRPLRGWPNGGVDNEVLA